MPFRVLSFDGGPTIGSYVRCLQAIEQARPGFLDRVDLLIGSSAGACTAVFLAGRLIPGADGAAVAADAVAFADGVLRAMAPQDKDAYKRLISGSGPLISDQNIQSHLSSLNSGSFLSLPRRVTLQSCRARAPYDPVVSSNYGSNPVDDDSVALVLRSSSLPLWSAPKQHQIDGALFSNNPSTTGLLELIASTRGTDEAVALDDVVMLSFGGDDGSSAIANLRAPGHNKIGMDPIALLKKLGVPMDDAIHAAVGQLAPLQAELARKLEQLGLSAEPESGEVDLWGWREWLTYPGNLAYVLQTWTSGEGRGAHWQCKQLLGERTFRVAPVGLLSTNEALLALLFGLPEPVIDLARMTASLWKDPVASQVLEFDRSVMDTLDWVDRWWMQEEAAGPRAAATPPPPKPRLRRRDRLLKALQAAGHAYRET